MLRSPQATKGLLKAPRVVLEYPQVAGMVLGTLRAAGKVLRPPQTVGEALGPPRAAGGCSGLPDGWGPLRATWVAKVVLVVPRKAGDTQDSPGGQGTRSSQGHSGLPRWPEGCLGLVSKPGGTRSNLGSQSGTVGA